MVSVRKATPYDVHGGGGIGRAAGIHDDLRSLVGHDITGKLDGCTERFAAVSGSGKKDSGSCAQIVVILIAAVVAIPVTACGGRRHIKGRIAQKDHTRWYNLSSGCTVRV